MYVCMYIYIYGLVFRDPPIKWYGSPRSIPGPSICKRFATFLASSLSFTRYMLPFRRPHILPQSTICPSSTAQGGGGSFKNRKPIGEVGCCESRMAERIHWWTERWLRSPLFLSLSLSCSDYLLTYLPIYLSIYRSIDLSISLSLSLSLSSVYLPI